MRSPCVRFPVRRMMVAVAVVMALSVGLNTPAGSAPLPPGPPYRLGLIDSRPTQVDLLPGLRVPGLQVLDVVPGSPADRAGLKAGDVVLAANAQRVTAPEDLRRVIAGSGGRLRLKVFEAHTEQVLNRTAVLGPAAPPVGPVPVTVTGRLRVGVVAVGAETTGVTLAAADGTTYDLDFGAARPPDREADGRVAVVSGVVLIRPGPERPGRRVIKVTAFRLVDGGPPRVEGGARAGPL
jgi:membrane-associated protease RseP (regulator of RpoE activity)